ncbi:pyridoxamine 5'-phosphate oxidase [Pseudonocardia sp. ICBG162]|uniref:pyridoxamine 5'-phosphate oxidase n=1 Tax=Pseudonocardia sp. ICBG162 TaxID=2846761 RepID=UPI001CF712DF|nr:pyridoxamine 5'-phosphate oxidase [Pseudonocardia sp. ICBG162]
MPSSTPTPQPDPTGFVTIAHRVVWCAMATVDVRGRPRSRIVHPVWTIGTDGVPVGRIVSRRGSPKAAHLAGTPFASCAYRGEDHTVAVAECEAGWDPQPDWDLFRVPPYPVGFEPDAMFAGGTGSPDAGVVVLRPWRLRWAEGGDLAAGHAQQVWRASDAVSTR